MLVSTLEKRSMRVVLFFHWCDQYIDAGDEDDAGQVDSIAKVVHRAVWKTSAQAQGEQEKLPCTGAGQTCNHFNVTKVTFVSLT